MYFPKDEYEARWATVYAELKRRGYDTAVLWQRTGGGYDRAGNVWYLSNYASHNIGQEQSEFGIGQAFAALLMHDGNEPELHVLRADYSEFESIERRHIAVERIVSHPDDLAAGLAAHLAGMGVEGRVAYVGDDFLPAQMYRPLLAGSPGIEWVPEEDLLYRLQSHASPREQELYREAGDISSKRADGVHERTDPRRPSVRCRRRGGQDRDRGRRRIPASRDATPAPAATTPPGTIRSTATPARRPSPARSCAPGWWAPCSRATGSIPGVRRCAASTRPRAQREPDRGGGRDRQPHHRGGQAGSDAA